MFIKSTLSSNNICQDPGWVLQSMRRIEGKSAWNHINWINYLFFFESFSRLRQINHTKAAGKEITLVP